jgi:hypothetical protein
LVSTDVQKQVLAFFSHTNGKSLADMRTEQPALWAAVDRQHRAVVNALVGSGHLKRLDKGRYKTI